MGSVLNYCSGSSDENQIKLKRLKQENENIKKQLILIKQQKEGSETSTRAEKEYKYNQQIEKLMQNLLKQQEEKRLLLNKYSKQNDKAIKLNQENIKLAQENEQFRNLLVHKCEKEDDILFGDNKNSESDSIPDTEVTRTPHTDAVMLRNWLIYKDLKPKPLKKELGKLLTSRNASHRSKIPTMYNERYGVDLMEDIARKIKKGSNTYKLIDGLFKQRKQNTSSIIYCKYFVNGYIRCYSQLEYFPTSLVPIFIQYLQDIFMHFDVCHEKYQNCVLNNGIYGHGFCFKQKYEKYVFAIDCSKMNTGKYTFKIKFVNGVWKKDAIGVVEDMEIYKQRSMDKINGYFWTGNNFSLTFGENEWVVDRMRQIPRMGDVISVHLDCEQWKISFELNDKRMHETKFVAVGQYHLVICSSLENQYQFISKHNM